MNDKVKISAILNETQLDHVAIAVSDLEKSVNFYQTLGLVFGPEREVVKSEGVKTAFAPLNQAGLGHLELLCPLDETSKIHQFIQKKGAGFHHLCFKVGDVTKKCEELRNLGMSFIYPHPVAGARGCLVNFIHPKSCGGVLIELSQEPEAHP